MRCIVDGPDASSKLVLLDEKIAPGRLEGLPEALQASIAQAGYTIVEHSVHMGYQQLQFSDVLRVRLR